MEIKKCQGDYKRVCFILETKQGVHRQISSDPFLKPAKPTRSGHAIRGTGGWDVAMHKVRAQAEGYARGLPVDEGVRRFWLWLMLVTALSC